MQCKAGPDPALALPNGQKQLGFPIPLVQTLSKRAVAPKDTRIQHKIDRT